HAAVAERRVLEVAAVVRAVGGDDDRHVLAEREALLLERRGERAAEVRGHRLKIRERRGGHEDRDDLQIGALVPEPERQRLEAVLAVMAGGGPPALPPGQS